MFRPLAFVGFLLAIAPPSLLAGPIYGSIAFNGAALRGATVIVRLGGREIAREATLDDGSYRLVVQQNGRCALSVTSSAFPGEAKAEVVSSSVATQYNFVVVKGAAGYELRRR
jgi:hypothetical protein